MSEQSNDGQPRPAKKTRLVFLLPLLVLPLDGYSSLVQEQKKEGTIDNAQAREATDLTTVPTKVARAEQ